MSSNGTNSTTPRRTPTSGTEEEETLTHAGHELRVITTFPGSRQQQVEPLSLLAESQRLQREMLRVELVRLKFDRTHP